MAPLDLDAPPEEQHHADDASEPALAALRTWSGWLRVAYVLQGVAFAALLAASGSPGWRLMRAGVAALVWWGGAVLSGRGPRLRIGVEGALGAVGVGVAVPIALSHLDQAMGVGGLRGTVAVVLLLASLAVLLGGCVGGVRRVRLGWRFLVVPLVLVALFVLWSVVIPAVAVTNVPPIAEGDRTPADVGLEAEDVLLRTDDGTLLAAWHVPTENGAAMVLLHGAGSTRDDVLDEAAVLADAGYGLVIPDAAGHGESEGTAMDGGWLGDDEVLAATAFLAEEPAVDEDRIGVVGLSMGGEQAIGAAAADPHVAAVVAEGATGRQVADKTWYADEYGLRGQVQVGIEWLQTRLTDLLTDAAPPTPLADAVAETDVPFLLIAAGDVEDEGIVAGRLQEEATDRVQVWVVPGSPHVGGLETDPGAWQEQVVGFLDDQLG